MDMAVDLEDLSISHFAGQADLDPNYLVKEGYGNVVKTLAEGLPISVATPATRIRYDGKGVVVETPKGDVTARACIITCSVGALNSGRIQFSPALPEWKEDAINRLGMGMLAKIPMLIEGDRFGLKPFEDLHYERPGRQDIYFLAFPFDSNLLIGFVGGKFGWELTAAGTEAAVDFGQESVRRIFGAEAEKKIVKADFTTWGRNPWIRGAYSVSLPGHHAARGELAKPVVNKLFFAGEALAGEFAQSCGGAFLSGRRTADDVNRILG
jgi:monoamine oxidase